jgi:hypothetical protein
MKEQRNDARIRQDEFAKLFDSARPDFEALFTGSFVPLLGLTAPREAPDFHHSSSQ